MIKFLTKDYWFPKEDKMVISYIDIENLIKKYGEKCERKVDGWAWNTCEKTGYLMWCCVFHSNYHEERLKDKY